MHYNKKFKKKKTSAVKTYKSVKFLSLANATGNFPVKRLEDNILQFQYQSNDPSIFTYHSSFPNVFTV